MCALVHSVLSSPLKWTGCTRKTDEYVDRTRTRVLQKGKRLKVVHAASPAVWNEGGFDVSVRMGSSSSCPRVEVVQQEPDDGMRLEDGGVAEGKGGYSQPLSSFNKTTLIQESSFRPADGHKWISYPSRALVRTDVQRQQAKLLVSSFLAALHRICAPMGAPGMRRIMLNRL